MENELHDDWDYIEDLIQWDEDYNPEDYEISEEEEKEDDPHILVHLGTDGPFKMDYYVQDRGVITYDIVPKEDFKDIWIQKAGKVEHFVLW